MEGTIFVFSEVALQPNTTQWLGIVTVLVYIKSNFCKETFLPNGSTS